MTDIFRTGMGQDSHRFLPDDSSKPCIIGGVIFEECPGFKANSDGDIVFHALCRAISSLTGETILGTIADEMLQKDGITDSSYYLKEALKTLGKQMIVHVAIVIEALRPRMQEHADELRKSIASTLGIRFNQVGVTFSTGEGLTDVGCGDGVNCLALITTVEKFSDA